MQLLAGSLLVVAVGLCFCLAGRKALVMPKTPLGETDAAGMWEFALVEARLERCGDLAGEHAGASMPVPEAHLPIAAGQPQDAVATFRGSPSDAAHTGAGSSCTAAGFAEGQPRSAVNQPHDTSAASAEGCSPDFAAASRKLLSRSNAASAAGRALVRCVFTLRNIDTVRQSARLPQVSIVCGGRAHEVEGLQWSREDCSVAPAAPIVGYVPSSDVMVLEPGEIATIKVLGVAAFTPEAPDGSFDLSFTFTDSKGKKSRFAYTSPLKPY